MKISRVVLAAAIVLAFATVQPKPAEAGRYSFSSGYGGVHFSYYGYRHRYYRRNRSRYSYPRNRYRYYNSRRYYYPRRYHMPLYEPGAIFRKLDEEGPR